MKLEKCATDITNKGFDFDCKGCKYRLKCLTNPTWLDTEDREWGKFAWDEMQKEYESAEREMKELQRRAKRKKWGSK